MIWILFVFLSSQLFYGNDFLCCCWFYFFMCESIVFKVNIELKMRFSIFDFWFFGDVTSLVAFIIFGGLPKREIEFSSKYFCNKKIMQCLNFNIIIIISIMLYYICVFLVLYLMVWYFQLLPIDAWSMERNWWRKIEKRLEGKEFILQKIYHFP